MHLKLKIHFLPLATGILYRSIPSQPSAQICTCIKGRPNLNWTSITSLLGRSYFQTKIKWFSIREVMSAWFFYNRHWPFDWGLRYCSLHLYLHMSQSHVPQGGQVRSYLDMVPNSSLLKNEYKKKIQYCNLGYWFALCLCASSLILLSEASNPNLTIKTRNDCFQPFLVIYQVSQTQLPNSRWFINYFFSLFYLSCKKFF